MTIWAGISLTAIIPVSAKPPRHFLDASLDVHDGHDGLDVHDGHDGLDVHDGHDGLDCHDGHDVHDGHDGSHSSEMFIPFPFPFPSP